MEIGVNGGPGQAVQPPVDQALKHENDFVMTPNPQVMDNTVPKMEV